MRRADKQITDIEVLNEILDKSHLCRLGLVDNGEAYIIPVNFAHSGGIIYIHSAPKGRKIKIIKTCKRVSFEMELDYSIIKSDIPCGWTEQYRSLTGKGTIEIETDPAAKKKGLDLIMRKYGADMELNYDENILSRMVILKLSIETVTGKQSGYQQID